jgi:pimeloyl-ACP methyl ester carboxylesterase
VRRFYVDTPEGQVHGVEDGEGPPILLVHHTPRSWTFYRRLIPLLSGHHRVIALDTLGFGASDPAPPDFTAAELARNVVHALDAMAVDRVHLFGAMTGTRIAVDVAVGWPARVDHLMLMALPFFESDAARDARMRQSQEQAMGAPEGDGSHVVKLWRYIVDNLAATEDDSAHVPGVYVDESTALSTRQLSAVELEYLDDWIVDAVRAGDMWRRAAREVYSEDPMPKLRALDVPVLVIGLTGKGFPPFIQAVNTRRARALIPGSSYVEIDAPDADSRVIAFHAHEIADAVLAFIESSGSC